MIGNIITFLLLGALFWWLVPADASLWVRFGLIALLFAFAYGKIKFKSSSRTVYIDGKKHTIYEPGKNDDTPQSQ